MNYYVILIYSYIFFLGLIFGSFFNVVGIRIPQKESLLGRSHCPSCGKTLGWLELFPVFGYIVLGGRCKTCKTHISVKYPLIELITGLLFLFSYLILHENMVEYILMIVFISLMVILTVCDIYYKIVPNIILICFLPVIFLLRMFSPVILWYNAIIGAVVGFGFMYLIALYGKKRFKQEALGGGDIKLYIIIGLVLGYEVVFFSVFFASLLGLFYSLIFKRKTGYIPFVPFIFAGSLIAYYFGQNIIDWYISIIY